MASETLDAILAECRQSKVSGASCWSLTPSHPRDLGARVAARGFEWGWRPHWMALDLHNMRSDFAVPEGLRIAIEEGRDWDAADLPLYDPERAAAIRILARANPRRTWHFGAWLNGRLVGHSLLFVTSGPLGAGGIYDVGVVPSARGQGIGKAISLAACQFSRALGCHYALLNSAADGIYRRIGFESLGYGQTWWMHEHALTAPPPDRSEVAFAEAIGQGDAAALDALDTHSLPRDLNAPVTNGMTPMELAVRAKKPASASWLEGRGASIDLLQAWDLGWKTRVRQMLAECPDLANLRSGDWRTTPLHDAVSRGDIALARRLLTANPDITIEDTQFHGTPLGWAAYLGQTEIKAMLEGYGAQGNADGGRRTKDRGRDHRGDAEIRREPQRKSGRRTRVQERSVRA
ncbi:MAG TPA: GNAT family N-acetyltransferase [Armatimonadota bacterium]|nr:GNAT family N-acetyltransferase [Armatimonadota bacterium]